MISRNNKIKFEQYLFQSLSTDYKALIWNRKLLKFWILANGIF